MQVFATTEIAAALLQAVITLGMAGLFLYLHRRYAKPHFLWWAVAWGLYGLRLTAIISFLATDGWAWLYWHQVVTGWTALAVLWAALVFAYQARWRPAYWVLILLPVLWSWVAIFRLDNFLLAAGTTVLFLSAATVWTGLVFLRYRRRTGSTAALGLAVVLLLWGLHHLDYPLLRARGAWNPWGYYLDLLFVLAMGAGVLLLVIEELRQGLTTLSTLSGDLRAPERAPETGLDALLRRPLSLRGVRGAALIRRDAGGLATVRGVGDCVDWAGDRLPGSIEDLVGRSIGRGQPVLEGAAPESGRDCFVAVLPLAGPDRALVILADAAAPFAALDDTILVAVGEQIGAALERADLDRALGDRTRDLERLSVRMIQQHEEQRGRLARELHDETAQVFAGLKLQLGALGEQLDGDGQARVDRLLNLVAAGTRSIRSVTDDLRPALLDDLGLLPALRALVADFREWSGLMVDLQIPDALPPLSAEAELTLFRAVQEGLSNVARHAQAERTLVRLDRPGDAGQVVLMIEDDGVGLVPEALERVSHGPGRSGLFGMRERMAALGGTVQLEAARVRGLRLVIQIPTEVGSA